MKKRMDDAGRRLCEARTGGKGQGGRTYMKDIDMREAIGAGNSNQGPERRSTGGARRCDRRGHKVATKRPGWGREVPADHWGCWD